MKSLSDMTPEEKEKLTPEQIIDMIGRNNIIIKWSKACVAMVANSETVKDHFKLILEFSVDQLN